MATITPKLGLPRPEGHDNVTRDNHNELIDTIDENAASQSELDAVKGTAESHAGRHAAGGADEITPAMIGAETPAGAQAKADDAEDRAKQHADNKVAELAGAGRTSETVKGNADALTAHLDETVADGVHGMGTIAKEDYEEGVWEPLYGGDNGGTSYNDQEGWYRRYGRTVSCGGRLSFNSIDGDNTYMRVVGFPFTRMQDSDTVGSVLLVNIEHNADTIDIIGTLTATGSMYLRIRDVRRDGSLANIPSNSAPDNLVILFTVTYPI